MPSIAIIGASGNRKKYGNKAVRAFVRGGWTVYPVNPKEEKIEGLKVYKRISDIPGPIDRISLYVPPELGIQLLDEIVKKNPSELFLNPGSESALLAEAAEKRGLRPIQACSVVNIGLRPEMFDDV